MNNVAMDIGFRVSVATTLRKLRRKKNNLFSEAFKKHPELS
jgi:hypothetical protein